MQVIIRRLGYSVELNEDVPQNDAKTKFCVHPSVLLFALYCCLLFGCDFWLLWNCITIFCKQKRLPSLQLFARDLYTILYLEHYTAIGLLTTKIILLLPSADLLLEYLYIFLSFVVITLRCKIHAMLQVQVYLAMFYIILCLIFVKENIIPSASW